MYFYKIFLELFFYGLILFAISAALVGIYSRYNHKRRNIRKSLRVIKNWY